MELSRHQGEELRRLRDAKRWPPCGAFPRPQGQQTRATRKTRQTAQKVDRSTGCAHQTPPREPDQEPTDERDSLELVEPFGENDSGRPAQFLKGA
ncbi:hypothetical protein Q427_11065 [Halomonas sp. BC04]|nr:hypothetical protein Q427_11065 [Halomonas sp. BC04]